MIKIQQQLSNTLVSTKYKDNFPIHINVKKWKTGMCKKSSLE